jgi:hypothetical protein
MRTSPLLLAAAAAGLAFATPAHASHAVYDCWFDSVAQQSLTNDRYTGAAGGYVVGAPGEAVSIACEIRVNGVTVDGTSRASGSTVAATSSPVRFSAADTDYVEICALVTHSHGSEETCYPSMGPTTTPPG